MIRIFNRNDGIRRRRVTSVLFLFTLLFTIHEAQCDEIYYIGDSPIFLYKTINWWYDSLPEESGKLCGKPIKCVSRGHAKVEYDAHKKNIEVKLADGFADMLLAFKSCRNCYGPSQLKSVWLHQQYFGNSPASIRLNEASVINGIAFQNVNKEQALQIQRMESDLVVTLEGVIGGLSNGRIALHASGDLLKFCRDPTCDQEDRYPIFLKISNANTHEILARFTMHWER